MEFAWYDRLVKPGWAPTPSFIGSVWTVLYPIIFAVFAWAIWQMIRGQIPWTVLMPIALNAASNIAFTPIQFGLKNMPLATLDILIVLVTIVWCMFALWPYSRVASLALSPYLVWVCVATALQLSIAYLNR